MKGSCSGLLLCGTRPAAAQLLLLLLLLPSTSWMTLAARSSSTERLKAPVEEGGKGVRSLSAVRGASSSRTLSLMDRRVLLDFHNRVRSQVQPTAANMELMVWDEVLAQLADSWASQCSWAHGPKYAMKHLGQNLSVTSGRYKSIMEPLKSWHEEGRRFSYPDRCRGSVCSHYTQMVWASSSRVGCAARTCSYMSVFGKTWREATLLICNYSIKGNWVGEAPYRSSLPCSVCPSRYGGSCRTNQCAPNTRGSKL